MTGENRRKSDADAEAEMRSDSSVLAELKRSFTLFFGIAVVLFAGAIAAVQLLDVPVGTLDSGIGTWLFGVGILITAFCCTVWLEEGGFDRIGGDPTAGGQFVWLALLYVPLAVLPLRAAAGEVVRTTAVDLLVVLGSMILAGWLSFFRGLAVLGIEPRHVGHVAVASLVLGAIGYVVLGTVPVEMTDPTVRAGAFLALQVVALWVGLSGIGDRLVER